MPTRQGWTLLVGAVVAIVIGRVFGIVELFIIGAALGLAVAVATIVVTLHDARLEAHRWAHPSVLTVGDSGRVDLMIENRGRVRSPRVDLAEPVGSSNVAHMTIGSLRAGGQVTAGYRVPALRRGVLTVGPANIVRSDLLGLASRSRLIAGETELTVAPQTFEMAMPALGSGVLGRHLLALSRRIGPGEFHSLRDYVPGDEPRSIHWRASARSDDLKVRQHEAQGVRRCIIVLDSSVGSYPAPTTEPDADVFERAVTVAGSLVLSSDRAGLTTRFVTGGGIDLRGPEVSTLTLRELARIDLGPAIDELERDPGEGLGLVVVVTSSPDTDAWRLTDRIADPTLTRVGVFTHDPGRGALAVDARSLADFRAGWQRIAGTRGLQRELRATEAAR